MRNTSDHRTPSVHSRGSLGEPKLCLFTVTHPGIRKPTGSVEGGQELVTQLLCHLEKLAIVPLHVLTFVLQHDCQRVSAQKTPGITETKLYSNLIEDIYKLLPEKVWAFVPNNLQT